MTATVRRRARRRPAELRREEILDAAERVFAHAPFRAAGTADIAREAGVAEPTIYRHFDSKRELYLAVVERSCTMVRDQFKRIAEQTSDAHEALHLIGEWYAQNICNQPDHLLLRQRSVAEAADNEVQETLRQGYVEIAAIIAAVLRRGQAQGTVKASVDADAAAWMFCGVGFVLDLFNLLGIDESAQESCGGGMIDIFKRAVMVEPSQHVHARRPTSG